MSGYIRRLAYAKCVFGRRGAAKPTNGDLLGCRVWGWIADECYDCTVYGLMFGRSGFFIIVEHTLERP